MHIYKLLFTYCVLEFISIFIFIIQTKFIFLFIIAIINRLFFHFVFTLENNKIGDEGAIALAEALKLNETLINIDLGNFCDYLNLLLQLLNHSIKFCIFHF